VAGQLRPVLSAPGCGPAWRVLDQVFLDAGEAGVLDARVRESVLYGAVHSCKLRLLVEWAYCFDGRVGGLAYGVTKDMQVRRSLSGFALHWGTGSCS
jgi:hypothetical protein